MLAAACPVFLDPQEPLERMAAQVDPVFLVPLDSLDAHHQCARNPHYLHAEPAHLVLLAQLDLPAPLEALDALDLLAAMEMMAPQANPDLRDLPDPLDNLEPMASLETQETQLSALPTPLETQDHKETRDHKVLSVIKEHLALMANLATPDLRDHLAHLDPKDLPDPMATLDLVAHLDPRESVVSVRNTALWMVVFSSKMEPEDKQPQKFHSRMMIFATALSIIYVIK